ncbi:MAG: chemotaxis protein CheD [Thermodesulfovibrionales bacterium]|nr:chemotaxis protein CheD [Thermodesulfovibrionales bacterium]
MKKIILSVGNIAVSKTPALFETVLGSCVSVCLWDEVTGAGGMNHFMVPYSYDGAMNRGFYGPDSTVELIHRLLANGASISSMRAKIFGGGKLRDLNNLPNIGKKNIEVAKMILSEYGIPLVAELTQLTCGMKIQFYSSTGRVLLTKLL